MQHSLKYYLTLTIPFIFISFAQQKGCEKIKITGNVIEKNQATSRIRNSNIINSTQNCSWRYHKSKGEFNIDVSQNLY
jgi:hypothetical protein